ncbi:MAG: hypothetical protein ABEJ42_09045 [Halobacteriaceae archaeon]
MDNELRLYLHAIVVLLSLIVGFLATFLLVSAESMSLSFFAVPVLGGGIAGRVVWVLVSELHASRAGQR